MIIRQIQTTITIPINIYIESDNVNDDSDDDLEQLRGTNKTFILCFNST